MAKLSNTVKEIIQIVIFLAVVGILLTAFVIYPLNRTKAMMGRIDIDDYSEDSVIVNDPTLFVDAGLSVDTFSVDSDGLTTVAGLIINNTERPDTIVLSGTVFLLHDDMENRDSLLGLSQKFNIQNFKVIAYDQRASGRSTGKYTGCGFYESSDLQEIISTMYIRGQIIDPLYVVGYGLGGDAVLLSALEEKRISKVVSINPFLTTTRYLNILKDEFDAYWFPFYRTMMFWWYKIRSSYAPPYLENDNIQPVGTQTLLLTEDTEDEVFDKIVDISDTDMLELKQISPEDNIDSLIIDYLTNN
jgi:pimeloyl-ACP methyl ester carboxylesterase